MEAVAEASEPMKSGDRDLGMDRPISRRDFLHGLGAVAAGSMIPGTALAGRGIAAQTESAVMDGGVYPPSLTGIRGNHLGSFEVAHQLAREGRSNWWPVGEPDADLYDLVVVGGGVSGLAAAYFYRKQHPGARILILDNHDDFGGHAKRNEFRVGNRTLIGYGGSQSIDGPGRFSDAAIGLLKDLGVDTERFNTAYDQDFFRRNGLGGGIYFNRETWGADQVVRIDPTDFQG
jgi:spermidine dehydrogenase